MWELGFRPQALQQQKGSAFEISGDKENKMGGMGLRDGSSLQADQKQKEGRVSNVLS